MFNSVTIIGLGLIGGSLAKAIHTKLPSVRIFAIDGCNEYIDAALKDGVIEKGGTCITKELCDSDLVMICTPISTIPGIVDKLATLVSGNTVISDAASVNKYLCDYADSVDGIRYVSTHPMAGSEKKGYFTSLPFLFENACTIISPCSKSDDEAITSLTELYNAIGALPVTVAPDRHDSAAALISHLPHIVASALVNLLKDNDPDGLAHRFAAGGFKDITRIASSTPEMWTDISLKNRDLLLESLDSFSKLIENYREVLASGDAVALNNLLSSSKTERDTLSGGTLGIIPAQYRVNVEVEDKVGVTSKISSILTEAGISIKNIAVRDSREYEGGIMTITVATAADAEHACTLLNSNGFTARTDKYDN